MNKTIRIAIGAMAICGSVLMGGGFVNAAEDGSSIKDLIPDTITLSVPESTYMETSYAGEKVSTLVKESVEQELTSQSVSYNSVNADCNLSSGKNPYNCYVGVSTEGDYQTKNVTVQYSDTSATNASDKAALQAKLDAATTRMETDMNMMIGAGQYLVSYHMYPADTAASVIAADNDKAINWVKQVVKELLNDSAYTIYAEDATMYGTTGFKPTMHTGVLVFKNGVYYGAINALDIYSYYDDTTVSMTEVAKSDAVYTELATKLADKGYVTILGAYELALKSSNGRYSLSFDVDSRYNGKTVVVLHKIADGNYEEFESVVKDGKVSIETSSLSPFMIALKETTSAGNNVSSSTSGTNSGSATSAKPVATKPGVGAPDTGVAAEADGSYATSAVLGSVILGMAGCIAAAFLTAKKIAMRKQEQ